MNRLRVFHSLRTRLIASYALVIFLSLFLGGSSFIYLLRQYQTQARLNQLAGLVIPIANQVWTLESQGVSDLEIGDLLHEEAAQTNVRILLVDPQQKIVVDTGDSMLNQDLALPGDPSPRRLPGVYSTAYRTQDGQQFRLLWLPARPRPPAVAAPSGSVPQLSVVLAVPPADLAAAWVELAPHLALTGLASLIISILASVFISRSITEPVSQVTRATEEIAKGNYDQRIPYTGVKEIGRLAATFNVMAQEVGTTHRTLRDLLINVSHDLRTPLTSIQGFSQAMLDGTIQTPLEHVEAAKIINDEAARMRSLVEDVLYLSRIESGQVIMLRQRLDLAELLRSCARRSARLAEQDGGGVDLQIGSDMQMEGDEHYLERAFATLLDNAVSRAYPGGTITVRTWLSQAPPSDQWTPRVPPLESDRLICVAIHSQGPDPAPDALSRIFERFYQADESRARSAASGGLGLAIVREIVRAHGGAVAARGHEGHGTEFLVVLPLPGLATTEGESVRSKSDSALAGGLRGWLRGVRP